MSSAGMRRQPDALQPSLLHRFPTQDAHLSHLCSVTEIRILEGGKTLNIPGSEDEVSFPGVTGIPTWYKAGLGQVPAPECMLFNHYAFLPLKLLHNKSTVFMPVYRTTCDCRKTVSQTLNQKKQIWICF